MSVVAEKRQVENALAADRTVYEPHRAGLPPMGLYLRQAWARRHFAVELARTNLRSQHYNTALGQLWLIANPLLLGLVYFVLVDIVRSGSRGPEFLAHLMLGLFAYRLVSMSVKQGAKSVVGGGRLILNTAFPRSLLPLSATLVALMRFLPMLGIYAVMHAVAGLPVGPHLLWVVPIFLFLLVFSAGVAMLAAVGQVYFRDLGNLIPYFLRIWLYLSPVLYYANEVPDRLKPILYLNPLFPMLAALSDVATQGKTPSPGLLLLSLAWAIAAFVVGALVFISREREFAVRL